MDVSHQRSLRKGWGRVLFLRHFLWFFSSHACAWSLWLRDMEGLYSESVVLVDSGLCPSLASIVPWWLTFIAMLDRKVCLRALKTKVFSVRALLYAWLQCKVSSKTSQCLGSILIFLGIWGSVMNHILLTFVSFTEFLIKLVVSINSPRRVTWEGGLLSTGLCCQGRQRIPFPRWFWCSPSWHLRDGQCNVMSTLFPGHKSGRFG